MTSSQPRLGVEALEARDCPAYASLYNSVLTVQGTNGTDYIHAVRSGDWIGVAGQWFEAAAVRRLVITASGGDDWIRDDTGLSAVIYGGVGNDIIVGGRGHDMIYGGQGDDTIFGNRGSDLLWGGSGNDVVMGGPGANYIDEGSPDVSEGNSALETEIITRVNAYRTANGLPPLAVSGRLNAAARLHSQDMVAISNRYGAWAGMQHQLLGTPRPEISDRLDAVGYDTWTRDFRYGENIAYGYTTAEAVVAAWIASPSHRENILSTVFTETGVGIRVDAAGRQFFTQDFGYLD